MEQTITKIEAAIDQLNWAIELHLNMEAHIPAVTLASAAEELLGRAVGAASAHERVLTELVLPLDPEIDRKYFSQKYLNNAKNWLKHWTICSEPVEATFDFSQEAQLSILRAIMNMQAHKQGLSLQMKRFLKSLP